MGPDAEPFTIMDLVGLVFVIVGFLTYSGFGFASNFIVVQVWKHEVIFILDFSLDRVHLGRWRMLTLKIWMNW